MSTTKNLGLFKHDNPSTNTDIFDVDKAINQNLDKIDTGIGQDRDRLDLLEASNTIYNFKGKVDTLANLQLKTKTKGDVWYCEEDSTYYTYTGTDWIPVNLNLKLGVIDELKAKTIKCLQEVETPTPVSGESIDLNDSAEAKIGELKISGNSKQETRKGYNLFNPDKALTTNSKTAGGATVTKNSDGSFTVSGSGALSSAFGGGFVDYTHEETIALLKEGKVTFDCGAKTYPNCLIQLMGTKTYIDINNNTTSGSATITAEMLADENLKLRLGFYGASGNTIVSGTIKPMLYQEGNGTFELFGKSPSSDYPSDNESCGDNINLFDKDNANILSGVYVDGNGYLNSSNKTKSLYIPCKKNTTYSISKILSSVLRVATTNQLPKLYLQGTLKFSGDTSEKCTITTSETDTYIVVYYYNSSNDTLTEQQILNSIKIVEGTETGEYSPYGQGCINEVICNKNILPYVEKVNYNMETGVDYYGITYTQKVKSNTSYILSTIDKLKSGFQLREYDKEGNIIQTTSKTLGTTFTTNSKTQYIKFRTNDLVSKITNPNFMLEESKTLSDYIEHKSQTYTIPVQQPFRAIGDIRDTFIKKNNKWYERHYEVEIVVDGTENITQSIDGNGDYFYNCYISANKIWSRMLSSHFKYLNGWGDSNVEESIYWGGNGHLLTIKANIDTVDNFKSWLTAQYNAGTPVYVDYILETPLDIECTEEQSTILFDIEQNAKTYDKVTHMYSTDEISPVIDVTYKKDIETLFANTLVESGV